VDVGAREAVLADLLPGEQGSSVITDPPFEVLLARRGAATADGTRSRPGDDSPDPL
jgi:hypothetical protein